MIPNPPIVLWTLDSQLERRRPVTTGVRSLISLSKNRTESSMAARSAPCKRRGASVRPPMSSSRPSMSQWMEMDTRPDARCGDEAGSGGQHAWNEVWVLCAGHEPRGDHDDGP